MDAICTSPCRQFEPFRRNITFAWIISNLCFWPRVNTESRIWRIKATTAGTIKNPTWRIVAAKQSQQLHRAHLCRMSVLLTGRSSLWWRKTAVDCSPEYSSWRSLLTRIFWTHCMKPLAQSFRPTSQAQPCHGRWVDLSVIPPRRMA